MAVSRSVWYVVEEAEGKQAHHCLPPQQRVCIQARVGNTKLPQDLLRGTSQQHWRVTKVSHCAVSALEEAE